MVSPIWHRHMEQNEVLKLYYVEINSKVWWRASWNVFRLWDRTSDILNHVRLFKGSLSWSLSQKSKTFSINNKRWFKLKVESEASSFYQMYTFSVGYNKVKVVWAYCLRPNQYCQHYYLKLSNYNSGSHADRATCVLPHDCFVLQLWLFYWQNSNAGTL